MLQANCQQQHGLHTCDVALLCLLYPLYEAQGQTAIPCFDILAKSCCVRFAGSCRSGMSRKLDQPEAGQDRGPALLLLLPVTATSPTPFGSCVSPADSIIFDVLEAAAGAGAAGLSSAEALLANKHSSSSPAAASNRDRAMVSFGTTNTSLWGASHAYGWLHWLAPGSVSR
jgi:hypothetical protein